MYGENTKIALAAVALEHHRIAHRVIINHQCVETEAMVTKKQATQTDVAAEIAEGAGSVDQIRDILFGPQIREMEKSIVRLEERLAKEAAGLRSDFKQRLEALETYAKDEVNALGQSHNDEGKTRESADDDLAREIKSLAKDTDKRLTKLNEQTRSAHKDLRKLILEQSKNSSVTRYRPNTTSCRRRWMQRSQTCGRPRPTVKPWRRCSPSSRSVSRESPCCPGRNKE